MQQMLLEEAAAGSKKPKLDMKARLKQWRAKNRAAAAVRSTEVEAALAALQQEETSAAQKRSEKAAAAAAAAASGRAAASSGRSATLLELPLSHELSGSLRSVVPLSSGQLLLAAMPKLAARGDVTARKSIPKVLVSQGPGDAEPVVTRHSAGEVKRSKGAGNPWKQLEFPRSKNFAPAEEAVRDAIAEGRIKGGAVPGLVLNFAASEAARVRAEGKKAAAKAKLLTAV
jgi:hypothetical protein